MENQKNRIKTIGMGFVGKLFGWGIGIIFILLGLLILYRGFASGLIGKLFFSSILFILSGFIVLPIFNLILIKIFKIQFSGWVRFFIFISLIIIGTILVTMALAPLIGGPIGNDAGPKTSIDENSPGAIKQINVSIGELTLANNLLSFEVIAENKGNVQISFQTIRLIFKDSKNKEVYSTDASYEEIVNLAPGDKSTTEMKVENWNAGNYTVSASILDLEGNILTSTERQFYV